MYVATGLEHSGTGLLARILRTSGKKVVHWAMPHVNSNGDEIWWWPQKNYPNAQFVTMVREPMYRYAACKERGWSWEEIKVREKRGNFYLTGLPDDTIFIRYEDLVTEPVSVVNGLKEALGVDLVITERIVNGNTKYKLS